MFAITLQAINFYFNLSKDREVLTSTNVYVILFSFVFP